METVNSVHLHYFIVTQIDPPVPKVQTAFVQESEFALNIDIYANMANEGVCSNVSLHQTDSSLPIFQQIVSILCQTHHQAQSQ